MRKYNWDQAKRDLDYQPTGLRLDMVKKSRFQDQTRGETESNRSNLCVLI